MSNGQSNGHATYPQGNGEASPQRTPEDQHAGQSNGQSNGHNICAEQRTPPTRLERVVDQPRHRSTTQTVDISCPEITALDLIENLGATYCWRLIGELRSVLDEDVA